MQTIYSLSVLCSYIEITGYQIKELKYNIIKTDDGYSYCGTKIPNRFSICSVSKYQIGDREITKLIVSNEPIITDNEISYGDTILSKQMIDIFCSGEEFENSDQ